MVATEEIAVMYMSGLHIAVHGWMALGTVGLGMLPGTVGQMLLEPGTEGLPVTTQGCITVHLPHDKVEFAVKYSVTGAGIG